jgi:branched-subunit amino acid aminotransferase/4-amino-4-deoxychorismate lyase
MAPALCSSALSARPYSLHALVIECFAKMRAWYDGHLFEDGHLMMPPDNAGLKFGATVFTTLQVHHQDLDHPLTQWQAHCDRLAHSIQQFSWLPPDWSAIYTGAQQLMTHHPILRITIFPDGREWIVGRSLLDQLTHHQQTGVTCWVAPPHYARSLPTHKTGNYLACWLARQQAQSHGAQEAILINVSGDWLETSTGNLWGWRSEKSESEKNGWYSPVHEHCLPGIMRSFLENLLAESGQPVSHQPWSPQRLRSFEALAYSNCAVGLLPIHTILDGAATLEYNPHHPRIKALQQQLAQLTTR